MSAVQSKDASKLASLAVTPAEYAWLIYPTSEHVTGPMAQAPQLAWYMLSNTSDVGQHRLLDRLGAVDLKVTGSACAPTPVRQGENRIWHDCVVIRAGDDGREVRQRLFGSIIERDGRWKVLSFANGF